MVASNLKSITFLGTGPSSGVPNLLCLSTNPCDNCLNPMNWRTCGSILIETNSNPIIFDCGKDFKFQYQNYLIQRNSEKQNKISENKKYNVTKPHILKDKDRRDMGVYENTNLEETKTKNISDPINNDLLRPTVVITHSHADAILGLDSLKQMTAHGKTSKLFADQETKDYLEKNFEYLFIANANNKFTFGAMEIFDISNETEFTVNDVKILPFYVQHGDGKCLAFKIDDRIVYISDCSSIGKNELKYLYGIEILIIECTVIEGYAFGHLNLTSVKEIVEKVKPKQIFLTGMSHLIDFNQLNEIIAKESSNYTICYDRMKLNI